MITEQKHVRLLPPDILCLALNSFFGILSLAFIGRQELSIFGFAVDRQLLVGLGFLASNGLLIGLIRFAERHPRNRPLDFFRVFAIQAFYIFYFTEVIHISQYLFGGRSLDSWFAWIDEALFGFQPAVQFPHEFRNIPWLTELFFFSYFFFYALITAGWWILYLRGKRNQAIRCLFIISASFAILYLWYIVFPVQGPKYFIISLHRRWYSDFEGYLFTRIMTGIFQGANLAGAAFPSSHVAISVLALILNAKYNRFLLPVFVPLTVTLGLSTVYIYAHYAVDSIAGVFVGIALYLIVPRLLPHALRLTRRFERRVWNRHFPMPHVVPQWTRDRSPDKDRTPQPTR